MQNRTWKNKDITENNNIESKIDDKNLESSPKSCKHSPQCVTRQPKTPPIGPPTLKQFELNEAIVKKDDIEKEIESFVENVLEFFKQEPTDNLDITVAKLEAIKNLLDPKAEAEGRKAAFDELIDMTKAAGNMIECLELEEDSDDYLDYENDDLPRHFYGEDGEIIFEED